MKNDFGTAVLFANGGSLAYSWLCGFQYPWEALPHVSDFIMKLGAGLPKEDYFRLGEDIWVAKSANIADSAKICGPCVICEGAEVRQGAFVRGAALVGGGAVVGNSTELKNCILFDGVQVPHYNYVGDSILGYRAHMGAGAITSNVKGDRSPVVIRHGDHQIRTHLKKLGAMLGDYVEIGCNSVLNPGTVIGAYTNVYPLSSVRGYVPANSIYKGNGIVVEKRSEKGNP
jgi:NDP-sugar pyrophosphorylase family protein